MDDMDFVLEGPLPTNKHESDGGPGVRTITDLLREQSSNPEGDVQSFVDAIAFNWLIAGTDAHAKNYALLLRRKRRGTTCAALRFSKHSALPDHQPAESESLP
jgi:hypothetical protein